MNRNQPSQDERDDIQDLLRHAPARRAKALDLIRTLELPSPTGRDMYSISVAFLDSRRSGEEFQIVTPLGNIVARFDLAKITDSRGQLRLYGIYNFYHSQVDDRDISTFKLICSLSFEEVHFRFGEPDSANYGAERPYRDDFKNLVFGWLLINLADAMKLV